MQRQRYSIGLLVMGGALLLQCTSDDASSGGSGPRLQVRYTEADGIRLVSDLYDTKREQSCTFLETGQDEEGPVFHCIRGHHGEIVYADPDCSGPPILRVLSPEGGCSAVEDEGTLIYAVEQSADGCHMTYVPLLTGALLENQDGEFYARQFGTGECAPASTPPFRHYFESREPALDDEYVRGRIEEVEVEGGGSLRFIQGSDGSRILQNTLSWEGQTCQPERRINDTAYCLPNAIITYPDPWFADSDCSTPVLTAGNSCGGELPSVAVLSETTDVCEPKERFVRVGEPITTLYNGSDDECAEVSSNDLSRYYTYGEEVTLPVLSVEELGEGRLRYSGLFFGGELLPRLGQWIDTELGMECSWTRIKGSDVSRCLPLAGAQRGHLYSDPECTNQVPFSNRFSCSDTPTRHYLVEYDYETDRCLPQVTSIHELEPYTGPLYELAEECIETDPETAGMLVWQPGRELSPEDFVPRTSTE